MAAEILEAPEVFATTAIADHSPALSSTDWSKTRAFYTIARGSSDAVANILSYLFMSRLHKPVTSLPPSIFSIYQGIRMEDTAGLVISQSGTSDDLVACATGIRKANGNVIALTNQPASPVED
ncbi:MAG: SIS domain-containing protein, partial [Paracoccaceae bacterium]